MYTDRQKKILTMLSTERELTVPLFSRTLGVSEVTVRKDLTTLERMGCLTRTHGGARIAEDFRLIRTIDTRLQEQLPEKLAIAKTACRRISPGDVIFLDAGSTTLLLAREIAQMSLHVVTNSLDIMAELSRSETVTLSCLGGNYRRESGAFVGPTAERSVSSMHFTSCFMGTSGFSDTGLFSAQNSLESEIKRLVLENSSQRTILADASKFGRSAFSVFARPGDVDFLVTDEAFSGVERYSALGIIVITAVRQSPG